MQLKIDCTERNTSTLTDHLVQSVSHLIASGKLPAGTRLPSIRSFAEQNQVSRFTVVQVYDRLVAGGLLQSRQGSGFYVLDSHPQAHPAAPLMDDNGSPVKTAALLNSCKVFPDAAHTVSRGTLPPQWLEEIDLGRVMRKIGRAGLDDFFDRYSDVCGYPPFCEYIQQRLLGQGISADSQQIITTSGAIPALELVCRSVLKPGDTVLVDEPGYYSFRSILGLYQAKAVGIPWHSKGPDIAQLEALAKQHQPVLYLTSAVNHNPTGLTLEPAVLHQVLRLAERHQFYVVEDDIFGVFHSGQPIRYATLDQFHQVVYINSYSKTISGRLRVGYMVLPEALLPPVLNNRVLYGRASEMAERVMYAVLREGNYRKHILHLIERLQTAREKAIAHLGSLGFELFHTPEYGLFVWARHPKIADSQSLMMEAQQQGIDLLPGHHFFVEEKSSSWLRFSVAWYNQRAVLQFMEKVAGG